MADQRSMPAPASHTLAGDAYRETGRFTDEVVIGAPVALRFRVAKLFS